MLFFFRDGDFFCFILAGYFTENLFFQVLFFILFVVNKRN